MAHRPESQASTAPRRPRWYLAYFLLAGFDIVVVVGSLALNHQLVRIHGEAARGNEEWATRLDHFSDLRRLAGDANAPGNDVFDSNDVSTERARLLAARSAFATALDGARKELSSEPADVVEPILADLDRVEEAMRRMADEADLIFGLFESGHGAEVAGQRMATMDRRFAEVNAAFATLERDVRMIEHERFRNEADFAARLQAVEWGLAALVCCMVAGAALYGWRMHREVIRSEEQLIAAKGEAEAAARAKSAFLANVSHEIRTPLHGIIGMADLALETRLSGEQREYLTILRKSAASLQDLLSSVLDLSRIEAGKLEMSLAPFRLRELVDGTLESLGANANDRDVDLAAEIARDVPDVLVGDAARLRQVLVNLAGNAVKFTERGDVVVAVEVAERYAGGAVLCFTIRDTGIGIVPEKISQLFEPFTQVDASSTRRHGGTGLGLAIVRGIVARMGGTIDIESAPGVGSTFRFTARFALAPDVADENATALAGTRGLLVDGHALQREAIARVLAEWGMDVVAVATSRDAVEAIDRDESSPFRVLIADLTTMPLAEAESACARRGAAGAAIVVLSRGALDAPTSARLVDESSVVLLLKPVNRARLRGQLLRLLSGAPKAEAVPRSAPRPRRLLIAEDNAVNRFLLVRVFERRGWTARIVGTGRDAVEAAREEVFDAIIVDGEMPELDGVEATRVIRAEEKTRGRRVPILALTAWSSPVDLDRFRAAGADVVQTKPIAPSPLLRAIDELIGEKADLPSGGWSAQHRKELSALLAEERPRWIERMRAFVDTGDLAGLAREAHGVKGAAALFGARGAAEAAGILETCARRGEREGAHPAIALLEDELALLERDLRADATARSG